MLVHFINTTKAYIITSRILSNNFLNNCALIFLIIFLFINILLFI